jgi:hypothetical protein
MTQKEHTMRKALSSKRIRTALLIGLMAGTGILGMINLAPQANAIGPTTRYVATTGSDVGDCSVSGTPCATIQYAINQAATGDIVSVGAGTYSELININKPLTLQGAQAGVDARTRSGAETILRTPAGQNFTLEANANNVTVDGFTIDGAFAGSSAGGITLSTNTHITNNILKNNQVAIGAATVDVSGLRVSQNLFDTNNLTGASDGVYLANATGSDIEVANNTFRNTDRNTAGSSAAAINIYGLTTPMSNIRILNNSSTNDSGFLALEMVTDVTVTGNTATNEAKAAVTIDRDVTNVTIANNTFRNSAVGLRFRGATPVGGSPITNVTSTNNTITGMSVAGVQIFADAIGSGNSFTGNTITGNAVGFINNSSIAVDANDNYWGCAAGPGHAGCDSVSGNVIVSTWIGQIIPKVPNTATAFGSIPTLAGAVIGLAVIFVGGVYLRRRAKS